MGVKNLDSAAGQISKPSGPHCCFLRDNTPPKGAVGFVETRRAKHLKWSLKRAGHSGKVLLIG